MVAVLVVSMIMKIIDFITQTITTHSGFLVFYDLPKVINLLV
jgi:hypothetical protein